MIGRKVDCEQLNISKISQFIISFIIGDKVTIYYKKNYKIEYLTLTCYSRSDFLNLL